MQSANHAVMIGLCVRLSQPLAIVFGGDGLGDFGAVFVQMGELYVFAASQGIEHGGGEYAVKSFLVAFDHSCVAFDAGGEVMDHVFLRHGKQSYD